MMRHNRRATRPNLTLAVAVTLCALLFISAAQAAQCVYVSSYHADDDWNAGIERGLDAILKEQCELTRLYLDARRRPGVAQIKANAAAAAELITARQPDVVIVADDSALKYLVATHLRNAAIPVVFCGVQWSREEYGEPYQNITGMVEVSPVTPLLKQIRRIRPNARFGFFLSAAVASEYQEYEAHKAAFAKEGITLFAQLVSSVEEWEAAYAQSQRYDFMILGNNAGIARWDHERAVQFAHSHTTVLTASMYDWMIPYAAIALTKVPEEQGEWAGKAALAILGGMRPDAIPIIPNRRWQAWVNPAILDQLEITLPPQMLLKARVYP